MDEEVLTENHRATTAHLLSTELLANSRKQFKQIVASTVRGPTVRGPIVWGPICQKLLEFVCVCVQIKKYSCCLCALLAGFKNELGLERNLFHSIRVFVPNNWDSNSRITEIQQLSLRPSGAV